MKDKFILDATCGGRTIWFNKNHPNAIYTDIRKEKNLIWDRPNFKVEPDMIMDFKDIKFPDKSFKMVVWDTPHFKDLPEKSWINKKYGSLNSPTWAQDIREGFDECWRVLEDFGTLVLKWSCPTTESKNRVVTIGDLLKILPQKPLFGHTNHSKSSTYWMCFMKIPGEKS